MTLDRADPWDIIMWLKLSFVIGFWDMCLYLHANFEQNKLDIADLKKLSGGSTLVEYRGVLRLYLEISDIQVPVLLNQNLRVIDSSKENLEVQLYCAGSVGWQRTEWISGDILVTLHFGPFRGKIHCYSLFTFQTLQLLESLFSTRYSINEFFDFDRRKCLS